MNLPNKITVSRIVLIIGMIIAMFVLVFIPDFEAMTLGNSKINLVYLIFCIVFIVAASTDFLDGYLARKLKLVTAFGKFLDPIADKLLNDATMIFLLVPQAYAVSQRDDKLALTLLMVCVIVMIARDLVVDGLRLIAVQKGLVIAANKFGKAKTVLQMIAIPMLLLNDWPFSYFDSNWPEALQISNIFFYLATLMSLISGIIYLVQNHKVLKETK
jgi:CDP-diacylglycerol---glycerol-3-phosphate 3-phosphatidyltransferase